MTGECHTRSNKLLTRCFTALLLGMSANRTIDEDHASANTTRTPPPVRTPASAKASHERRQHERQPRMPNTKRQTPPASTTTSHECRQHERQPRTPPVRTPATNAAGANASQYEHQPRTPPASQHERPPLALANFNEM
jgi:hypothetical protein